MSMTLKKFYLTEPQLEFLQELVEKDGSNVSEHVRLAINEYIERLKDRAINASPSRSKIKVTILGKEEDIDGLEQTGI